ncbi:metallophosphoesterase [Oceanobacillus sp. FSL K6-2867]|uniref:metallophosphoesterase n=1 Tax=Oceanobacillus sp. FSL K6-2867 TaxID=2954748 RepID=UPI0030D8D7FB
MAEVLILSDSHGLSNEVVAIKERHDVKWSIHCGDSELEFDADELQGFYRVGGNCDFDVRYPDEQTIELDGLTFYITHGHLFDVKMNLMRLSYRAEEENAQVVCFGHSHIAGAEKVEKKLFINPGSIRLPKGRNEKTYAIMRWDDPSDITIHFYNVNGELVEALTKNVSI